MSISFEGDMVGDLTYQLHVFTFIGVKHGFTDSGCYFLFIETDDASVTLEYRLYHFDCIFRFYSRT